MLNLGCTNGSLNGQDNYSSPVPVIGVYIAAASLVCLLLMVYDVIFAGILPNKKRWLPCKWFALNSVTLTLLSVAAKLTVDLTTAMPSRWDQLSKLTGTAFVCIGMGFIIPSIGVNSESECLTNMMALTIFVITVTVNISIQLSTGVIFMFIVEHIIILGLMMLLLLILWHISFDIKAIKRNDAGACTPLGAGGSDSMFERLKLCYIHAYCSNPQLKLSMHPLNITAGFLCTACIAIIIEATFRSLIQNKLEFREGVSDYSWSMPYIVIIQILTALLGCIPIVTRGVAMFYQMDYKLKKFYFWSDVHFRNTLQQQIWKAKGIVRRIVLESPLLLCCICLLGCIFPLFLVVFVSIILWLVFYCVTIILKIVELLILSPWLLLHCFGYRGKPELEHFVDRCATKYSVGKSIDDMIRLMSQVSGSKSVYQPSMYLSQRSPSQYLNLNSMEIRDGDQKIEISVLSMRMLEKLAEASIPKDRLVTLVNTFEEAREVMDYIYTAMQKMYWPQKMLFLFLREWKKVRDDLSKPSTDPMVAIDTIKKFKETMHNDDGWGDDLCTIIDFIDRRRYLSIEELSHEIEQLFTDMLHALFAQLPKVIFYSISKTQGEEYEDSVRLAMKLLFQIGSFRHQYCWAFPEGMISIDRLPGPRECTSGQLQRLEDVVLVCRDTLETNMA